MICVCGRFVDLITKQTYKPTSNWRPLFQDTIRIIGGAMKTKLVIAGIFLVAITVVGIRTTSQNLSNRQLKDLEEKEKRHSLTIRESVKLAKIRGKKQVIAPSFVSLQPIAQSPEEMETLLPRYSIILAEVAEHFGYLKDDEIGPGRIVSWYKFRTIDVVSQAPPRQSFVEIQIPDELRQLKDDEFILPSAGGSAIVDGVEVIQNDQTMPRLKKSQKYLLLLSLDPATRIAKFALGPHSMLPVNADHSLDPKMNQLMLQQTIMKFHNRSLDQLKRNIHK